MIDYKRMSQPKLPGQILLVTLIVLTVITVIVIGVAAVSNRDAQQTLANQQYEKLYNNAETELFTKIDQLKAVGTIGSLTPPSGCTVAATPNTYTCITTNPDGVQIETTVSDIKNVTDYEAYKDEPVTLNLNAYSGRIAYSWSGNVAMEFDLILERTSAPGVSYFYSGVSDPGNKVYEIAAGAPTALLTLESDANRPGDVILNLSAYSVANGWNTKYLQLVPRMKDGSQSTKINMTDLSGNLANQFRQFDVKSYQDQDASNVVSSIRTIIPINPQPLGLLSYSLLTDGNVSKTGQI